MVDPTLATYPGLLGFREVAGLRCAGGGCLRSGVLYRSGTPQFLDEPTARRLLSDTGIATTIDLRLPHEVDQEGRGPFDALGVALRRHPVRVGAVVSATSAVAPMTGDDPVVATYLRYLDEEPRTFAAVAEELARPGTAPALVHCTVGKDRTGVMIALLLAAVGVPVEEIAAEYARGADEVPAAMERLRGMTSYGDAVDVYPPQTWVVEADTISRFLHAVDDRHGGARAFLAAHGRVPHLLEQLEDLLVEPATAQRFVAERRPS
ncbi:tyrosine-protein phosphatase [Amycolatopsis thermoflava]|uniref:tyrosine-protein phosphatase n=1 Tax=Amycolatopsis thermoflava TaxID=84480 RepID=UPI0036519D31